jgi:hypothetical protein
MGSGSKWDGRDRRECPVGTCPEHTKIATICGQMVTGLENQGKLIEKQGETLDKVWGVLDDHKDTLGDLNGALQFLKGKQNGVASVEDVKFKTYGTALKVGGLVLTIITFLVGVTLTLYSWLV